MARDQGSGSWVLAALTKRSPSLLCRDMGDVRRANYRRGKGCALSDAGGDGASRAMGLGLSAHGLPELTSTQLAVQL